MDWRARRENQENTENEERWAPWDRRALGDLQDLKVSMDSEVVMEIMASRDHRDPSGHEGYQGRQDHRAHLGRVGPQVFLVSWENLVLQVPLDLLGLRDSLPCRDRRRRSCMSGTMVHQGQRDPWGRGECPARGVQTATGVPQARQGCPACPVHRVSRACLGPRANVVHQATRVYQAHRAASTRKISFGESAPPCCEIIWLTSPGPYVDPGDYQGKGGEVLQANQGKWVFKVLPESQER